MLSRCADRRKSDINSPKMSTPIAIKILHIDDDPAICDLIRPVFSQHGWTIHPAATLSEAVAAIGSNRFDVMVVDRTMPDGDGLETLRRLRQGGLTTPAIIVSAMGDVDNRVLGLTSGADDYLSKPFAVAELAARVKLLLGRSHGATEVVLRSGPLELDLENLRMRRGDRVEILLSREARLLAYLMRHTGTPLTRPMLLRDVWNFNLSNETNVIDVHISKLRKKVDCPGEQPLIRTIKGVGFIFATDGM